MNAKASQGSLPSQLHALEDSELVFTLMAHMEGGPFLLRPEFQTVSQTLPLHAEGPTVNAQGLYQCPVYPSLGNELFKSGFYHRWAEMQQNKQIRPILPIPQKWSTNCGSQPTTNAPGSG